MLGLKVNTPFNRVLEVSAALLEYLYRIGIGDLLIIAVCECRKAVKKSLFNALYRMPDIRLSSH